MNHRRLRMCERDLLRFDGAICPRTVSIPSVKWAQSSTQIFLTVCLEDVKNPDIKVDNFKLFFKGIGGSGQKLHQVTFNFFKEVLPRQSKYAIHDRFIEFVIEKKESGIWQRLLSDNVKFHWLKTDFNKWKDEDGESDEEDEKNYNEDENYQHSSRDYSRHIAENFAKGSSLCPLGQMMMGTPTSFEAPQTLEKVDLHQFDENATDSDDEALSDLE